MNLLFSHVNTINDITLYKFIKFNTFQIVGLLIELNKIKHSFRRKEYEQKFGTIRYII